MKVKAFGKINLTLDVTGRREDGFHLLDTVMQTVSIWDELDIQHSHEPGVHLQCSRESIPTDRKNTAFRAAKFFLEDQGLTHEGVYIFIRKYIPSRSGMGGGSADAAAVMKAIVELEGLDVSLERLMELGAKVGADVPFCLLSRWARVQGIGERVVPIESDWRFFIVLVKPAQGVSTPQAFARWDEGVQTRMDVDRTQAAVERNDLDALMASVCNALEAPAIELVPAVEQVRQDLLAQGVALARMTGSGSAVMGFSRDKSVLERAAKSLRTKYPFVEIVQVG